MADEGSVELEARGWQQLVTAGRWAYDVLRGYSWSRHLDQSEK